MKAELKPLKGKYYGTEVIVKLDSGKETIVVFWVDDYTSPSSRELALVEKEEDPNDYIDWSHYESETSLMLAELFVKAVNGG